MLQFKHLKPTRFEFDLNLNLNSEFDLNFVLLISNSLQGSSMVMWALATGRWGVPDGYVKRLLLPVEAMGHDSVCLRDLATHVWACAVLGTHPNGDWMDALLSSSKDRLAAVLSVQAVREVNRKT
jgi:hypothetical protein